MAANIPTEDDMRRVVREELDALRADLDGRVEPYLNTAAAATFLSTTEESVRWLVAHRALPHRRAQGARKGRLLFLASELRAWVEETA